MQDLELQNSTYKLKGEKYTFYKIKHSTHTRKHIFTNDQFHMVKKTHSNLTKFESLNLHALGLNGGLKPRADLNWINKTGNDLTGKILNGPDLDRDGLSSASRPNIEHAPLLLLHEHEQNRGGGTPWRRARAAHLGGTQDEGEGRGGCGRSR